MRFKKEIEEAVAECPVGTNLVHLEIYCESCAQRKCDACSNEPGEVIRRIHPCDNDAWVSAHPIKNYQFHVGQYIFVDKKSDSFEMFMTIGCGVHSLGINVIVEGETHHIDLYPDDTDSSVCWDDRETLFERARSCLSDFKDKGVYEIKGRNARTIGASVTFEKEAVVGYQAIGAIPSLYDLNETFKTLEDCKKFIGDKKHIDIIKVTELYNENKVVGIFKSLLKEEGEELAVQLR